MIPDSEIDRIKQTADIAAVIRARGVELKPSGGDLVGRCPFHDDHDPSLRVTPAKGLWRCMSAACGAAGNVIQFVQKFDGVSFRHAYEILNNNAAFCGAPTRTPVNGPGPRPTATAVRSATSSPAAAKASAISGTRLST
jgi:DNA primase